MKKFKALLFVLVLAPVSVFATIVDDSNNFGNKDGGTSYAVNLDAIAQSIIVGQNEVTANWVADLEQESTLNITFVSTTLGLLDVGISDFTVMDEGNISGSGIFTMDLDQGMHTSFIKGRPSSGLEVLGLEGDGVGKIHTVSALFSASDISQAPAPPGVWSMGAAMLGLLTVGRRNKANS